MKRKCEIGLMKECRLCASKEGPFINIFGDDSTMATKIKTLMPLSIDERDELPHKICFRCSAKVVELHDFSRKCVETQSMFLSRLPSALGKERGSKAKKVREAWKARLARSSDQSNDRSCEDAVLKAMLSFEHHKTGKPVPLLKDLSVRLVRIDDILSSTLNNSKPPKVAKKAPAKIKPVPAETPSPVDETITVDSGDDGELRDNITFMDVSAVKSIYTCNVCHRIFTQKVNVTRHECKKEERQPASPLPSAAVDKHVSFALPKPPPVNDFDAPYPVNLLCRNSGDGKSRLGGFPSEKEIHQDKEYKILSRCATNKIVIASVPKTRPKEAVREIRKSSAKKSKTKSKNSTIDLDPINDSSSIVNDEPFFTIYNVEAATSSEPMYVLPTVNTIQESLISTTGTERGYDARNFPKEEPLHCTLCNKTFVKNFYYKQHMKRKHMMQY